MSKIVSFKLSNGQEIIAGVISTLESLPGNVISYKLRRPHILQMQQTGPNQVGLAFIPWTLSNPNISELDLPVAAIMVSFEPSASSEKQYLEQTSGISLHSSL